MGLTVRPAQPIGRYLYSVANRGTTILIYGVLQKIGWIQHNSKTVDRILLRKANSRLNHHTAELLRHCLQPATVALDDVILG